MRKVLNISLAFVLLLPALCFGADLKTPDPMPINKIEFKDIQKEVLDRSPSVRIQNEALAITKLLKSNSEDTTDQLENQIAQTGQQINNLASVANTPQYSDAGIPANVLALLNNNLTLIKNLYSYNATQLRLTNNSQAVQYDSTSSNNDVDYTIESAELTTEKNNYVNVKSFQDDIFLSYYLLQIQKQDIQNSIDTNSKKKEVLELQKKLGIVTNSSVIAFNNQLESYKNSLSATNTQIEGIIRLANLMLGQDSNTSLTFGDLPNLKEYSVSALNYSKDYEEALANNYGIKIQQISCDQKYDAADRLSSKDKDDTSRLQAEANLATENRKLQVLKDQFKSDFKKLYDSIVTKDEELKLAIRDLDKKSSDYVEYQKKYELGLISKIGISSATSLGDSKLAYESQKNKVQKAEIELYQLYNQYEWLKKGI
ncbi:TolC family protein [Dehalobacter restrictus]|uniref:Outer membrane efflux protein n=1 Tax=Dehalobacter restrictus (strain DSM 9455 / PER-K23) TaxID=871738 RepID=A0ABN4BWY5_DEHRP|nr:TolC family protein [Dehalobacter restrictus]AHF11475.1 hypothetical protein DEHRE_13125 [Dehalobacter restrictus DSM 9455]